MHVKWSKWKDVEVEVRFGKRMRRSEHVDGVASHERDGDFALVRYEGAAVAPAPEVIGVLELLRDVKAAGWVLGDVSREAFSGARLRRVSRAKEVRRAFHEGWDYAEGDPPERLALSLGADYMEGMKGWATWDLYLASAWLDHPLRERCRSKDWRDRPSVEECLAAARPAAAVPAPRATAEVGGGEGGHAAVETPVKAAALVPAAALVAAATPPATTGKGRGV